MHDLGIVTLIAFATIVGFVAGFVACLAVRIVVRRNRELEDDGQDSADWWKHGGHMED